MLANKFEAGKGTLMEDYNSCCKGQQLSKLHAQCFELKAELESKNYPALNSRSLTSILKRLEGGKGSPGEKKPKSALRSVASRVPTPARGRSSSRQSVIEKSQSFKVWLSSISKQSGFHNTSFGEFTKFKYQARQRYRQLCRKSQGQTQGEAEQQRQRQGQERQGRQEGQISLKPSARLRGLSRAHSWLTDTSKIPRTSFSPSSSFSKSITMYASWFGKLSLAEVTFLPLVASEPWAVGPIPEVPMCAKWVLGLGAKFVPPLVFGTKQLDGIVSALADFKQKVHNRMFLDWTAVSKSMANRVYLPTLPDPRGIKSSWAAPQNCPLVEQVLQRFTVLVKGRAEGILNSSIKFKHSNTMYYQGLAWLKSMHAQGKLILGIADKGYEFCLVSPAIVWSQFSSTASSGAFDIVSKEYFLESTWTSSEWLRWKLDWGWKQGLISRKCLDWLLAPRNCLQLDPLYNHDPAMASLGKLRYMAKLHKLPELKFRRIENDKASPISRVAKWVASLLEPLVQQLCFTCAADSKVVLTAIENAEFVVPDGASLYLVASDIVDYFDSIDITAATLVAKTYVTRYYGAKAGASINELIGIIVNSKFFYVKLQDGGQVILHKKNRCPSASISLPPWPTFIAIMPQRQSCMNFLSMWFTISGMSMIASQFLYAPTALYKALWLGSISPWLRLPGNMKFRVLRLISSICISTHIICMVVPLGSSAACTVSPGLNRII